MQKQKIFKYTVQGESAEIDSSVFMKNNLSLTNNLVFSECDSGQLTITNKSKKNAVKNVFVICSHPSFFGFKVIRVTDQEKELGPNEDISVDVDLRATLAG